MASLSPICFVLTGPYSCQLLGTSLPTFSFPTDLRDLGSQMFIWQNHNSWWVCFYLYIGKNICHLAGLSSPPHFRIHGEGRTEKEKDGQKFIYLILEKSTNVFTSIASKHEQELKKIILMSQSSFVFCTLLMAQCKVRATVYQQFVKLLPTLLLPAWGSNCSQNDTIDTIGCRICGSSLCKAVSRVKLEAVCGTNYVCPPPQKKR